MRVIEELARVRTSDEKKKLITDQYGLKLTETLDENDNILFEAISGEESTADIRLKLEAKEEEDATDAERAKYVEDINAIVLTWDALIPPPGSNVKFEIRKHGKWISRTYSN